MTQLPDHSPRSEPPAPAAVWSTLGWNTYLTRALASLLVSLVGLIGWHFSDQAHSRLPLASQTSPALPELRPVSPAPVSFAGVGGESEAALPPAAPRYRVAERVAVPTLATRPLDLTVLGRMNLDGG
ncbi:hypothetical protein [Deinococcus ruber]|uniref:hypothetical protein n=1 Tax=Deinococcus ruber TaxID=1848197 RepID=UPI00166E46A8|nr:hypothetical protein [Deinococcus ruber]